MAQRTTSRPQHAARSTQRWTAGLSAAVLALIPSVASAQEVESTSDRDRVMLWTAIAAIVVLALAAIGYAYRRMRGMDHPTPDELEMMGSHHGGHDEPHSDLHAGEAAAPHAEAGHVIT